MTETVVRNDAVELTNVSRWYGNVVAVNDISFRLDGGVTGLLGPNGAGKSTILHMVGGFLAPSSGSVTVGGSPSWGHPEMYRRIGLVPEREAVYPFLTGREFAHANARLQGMPQAEAAEAAAQAIGLVELEDAADRPIGTYSKGMRQRAKVAAALVHDPPILLLDEPFNGMDPRQRLHMMDLFHSMAAAGRTILFSSHILEEVERLAGQVLVIVSGRLAASGDFREIDPMVAARMLSAIVVQHGIWRDKDTGVPLLAHRTDDEVFRELAAFYLYSITATGGAFAQADGAPQDALSLISFDND